MRFLFSGFALFLFRLHRLGIGGFFSHQRLAVGHRDLVVIGVDFREGEEAVARRVERQVTIAPGGEGTNTLLVGYSPRMESQVISVINSLDRLPPAVMIQVLMAEVTIDNRFEMGMEFAVQDLLFSERAVLGPNDTLQGDHFDFVVGSDIGAAGSGGLSGFSFTVSGEDFNFLLRALQREDRLEVLSRPSIMVQDQQEASIDVGSEIPIVSQFNIGTTGTVTPSVNYETVGVKLMVTPIISPDGYVSMKIEPEISDIGPTSIAVATGVTLPTILSRKASTTVTVKDGETIIIGGLITTRENKGENKVPLVGDIPILGSLFRAETHLNSKTELLIVLTPHVIRDMEDAHTISVHMRDQTGLMENVRKSPLMNKLQIKPGDEELGPEPLRPIEQQERDTKNQTEKTEPMGPVLEKYGPTTSLIRVVPRSEAITIRAERMGPE